MVVYIKILKVRFNVCRFILRVVCCALGIIIEEDESECKKNASVRFLISNHISVFDFVPIHLLTNCEAVSIPYLTKYLDYSQFSYFFIFFYIYRL